jgi:glutaredoxin
LSQSQLPEEEEYEGKAGGDPDGPSCPQCFAEIRRANENFVSYERVKFKLSEVANELKEAQRQLAEHRAALDVVSTPTSGVWFWMGEGDRPESLVCPVVMSADTLRSMVDKIDQLEAERKDSRP